MKKIFSLLLSVMMGASAFAQNASMAVGTSFPMDGYKLVNVLNGREDGLKTYTTNRGLLVIFTCNTCPFVLKNVTRTAEILAYAKQREIGVILVNSNEAQRQNEDSPKSMIAFGKEHNYPNYVIDKGSMLANILGASHTPEVYLFDGNSRKLVYKGAMDDNPADPASAKTMYLKNAMSNLVAKKDISPTETKSIGCGIKRVK
jgi:hypothetical protein